MLSLECMGHKSRFNDKPLIYWTQVARDEDIFRQIGKDIFFDLVDHDKVLSFRIEKETPFFFFKVWTIVLSFDFHDIFYTSFICLAINSLSISFGT